MRSTSMWRTKNRTADARKATEQFARKNRLAVGDLDLRSEIGYESLIFHPISRIQATTSRMPNTEK
jgi:hypothetical protein